MRRLVKRNEFVCTQSSSKWYVEDGDYVIKMGNVEALVYDYRISQLLKPFIGFVNDSAFMKMPYYPLGSIASYPWTAETIGVLRSCLYVACLCYMDAFDSIGFIHNDFHAANILLKETRQTSLTFSDGRTVPLYGLRPWIMDFEKSVIMDKTARAMEDFRYDLYKVFLLLPTFIPTVNPAAVLRMGSYVANRETLWDGIQQCVVFREG